MKNKSAFSYLELLFGMVIVVSIFLASVPFVTQRITIPTSVAGEYVCFTAYNNATAAGTYRLYEAIKRGGGAFSTPVDVTNTGCTFYKQKNVKQYTVTIIGGGGAGNVPKANNFSGVNGSNGQSITVVSSLAGVWDENGVLTINKCKKAGLFVNSNPYEEEYKYCVGSGGESPFNRGLGALYNRRMRYYYQLLGVYHDIAYELRENVEDVVYAGRGNGLLDGTDSTTFANLLNATYFTSLDVLTESVRSSVASYTAAANPAARNAARADLITRGTTENYYFVFQNRLRKTINGDSEGADGEYSRFVIYDNTSLSCPRGNCIARGGSGAVNHPAYATASCPATAASNLDCRKNNTLVNNINLANWTNFFGKGGLAGGSIRTATGTWYRADRAPVGNGGAIVIRW